MPRLDYESSLTEISGKVVADVVGYRCDEFGEPAFKLTRILFTDGTAVEIEGEHDFPYLSTSDPDLSKRIEESP